MDAVWYGLSTLGPVLSGSVHACSFGNGRIAECCSGRGGHLGLFPKASIDQWWKAEGDWMLQSLRQRCSNCDVGGCAAPRCLHAQSRAPISAGIVPSNSFGAKRKNFTKQFNKNHLSTPPTAQYLLGSVMSSVMSLFVPLFCYHASQSAASSS